MSLLLLLLACGGPADPCADRRDLAASPAGLDLTAEEHPTGWGHADCFLCHQRWTVHVEDCIDGVAVDVDALEVETVEGCVACHGANGVAEWQDLETTE